MPYWTVSEPDINLRIEDRPLGYQPGRGRPVVFQMSYRQRGAMPQDDQIFGLGPGWSSSFCSYLIIQTNAYGEIHTALHRGGAGVVGFSGLLTPEFWSGDHVSTPEAGTWLVNHPDGSRDLYSVPFTNSQGIVLLFLFQQLDPLGNALTYTYTRPDGGTSIQLDHITDADGKVTVLSYAAGNRIQSVEDPYGRSCFIAYDEEFRLSGVTDAQGLTSGFTYADYGGILFIDSMSTPYGTTYFTYGGCAVTTADHLNNPSCAENRYVLITQPDGGHQLYLYRRNGSGVSLPTSYSPVPSTSPFANAFDNVDQSSFNSFHWDALQYSRLSTTTVESMTASDYQLGRQRHWLIQSATAGYAWPHASHALSTERAPSPDGTTPGQVTWYDYPDKPAANQSGPSAMPLFVARVLPGGETAFDYTERNDYHAVTRHIETYTQPNGAVGLRTNTFTYGANGIDLVLHVGPLAEQVVSNYFGNPYHQPDASYDALNQETRFTYNGLRQVIRIERPSGLTTTNLYFASGDYAGWLSQTIDLEIGRTNTFTYANGLLYSHTDERGLTTTNYWDHLLRLTGVVYPDGTGTTNLYTAGGTPILDLTATKDRLGHWTFFGYDAMRRRIAETNANGVITRYGYCDCGALESLTAAWGTPVEMVTTYTYDNQGNRLITTTPDASSTNWFNPIRQLICTADGATTNWYGYNNQGLLTSVTNGTGLRQQAMVFDLEDRTLYATDANGVSITNTFDALGRLRTRTYPDGGVERFGYSARGLAAYTNQLDKVTTYGYDEALRKVAETNANHEVLLYTNNAAGDLLSLTDGKNQTTRWGYDAYGRVTNKLDQAGAEILRYAYDPNNRLTNRWSAAKGNTVYRYDPVGNLTNIDYAISPDITLRYDALNRVTNMVDAVGTTAYGYTPGGRLASEDGPWSSDTVTNGYSSRVRTNLSLQQPAGFWTNAFGYDPALRLTNVTSPAGVFAYTLGGASEASPLPRKLALPNGSTITNAYDGNARLLFTKLFTSGETLLDGYTYGYNAGNQRTGVTRSDGSTVAYAYDAIGQLKVADSSVSGEDRGYAYDPAWNLRHRTNNGVNQNFHVNGKNELTNYTYGGFCTYDANGNLTNRVNGTWQYGYDDENQLANLTNYAGSTPVTWTRLTYDGRLRLRVRQEYTYSAQATNPGPESLTLGLGGRGAAALARPGGGSSPWQLASETRYIYDGMRVIQERDANNVPVVSYTRGTDLGGSLEGAGGIGGLLARSHGYGGGNWATHNYYHADGNGNVTYLVDSGQGLAASYRYDAYGNTLAASGSLATANVYRFSSKEIHVLTGLYYYGYRWYAPDLQRWPSRDPIEEDGGYNLYGFVGNNPISEFDPNGQWYPGFPGKPQLPPMPPIDCSGYSNLGGASCKDCGKVRQDNYPQQAQSFCEGFKKLYTGSPAQGNAACVASCLIKAEKGCQSKYQDCDRRNCCRLLAHVKCYAQCTFIPFEGMPPGAWDFGWGQLAPAYKSLLPEMPELPPGWPPSY